MILLIRKFCIHKKRERERETNLKLSGMGSQLYHLYWWLYLCWLACLVQGSAMVRCRTRRTLMMALARKWFIVFTGSLVVAVRLSSTVPAALSTSKVCILVIWHLCLNLKSSGDITILVNVRYIQLKFIVSYSMYVLSKEVLSSNIFKSSFITFNFLLSLLIMKFTPFYLFSSYAKFLLLVLCLFL